ncbi:MAG: glycosyltransferase family 4 protein [Thermoanaerobaculia bacterium]|nr:glycosyltransferase family 4 protein [Thermoanaerobaculia bacterium]
MARDDALHVGVVAYEMEGRRSGVGRYLEGLLRGLSSENPDGWRWTLFFRGDPFPSELFSEDPSAPIRGIFDGRPSARPIVWEQLRLPRLLSRYPLDFLFSPAYSLPPSVDVPCMLTLHDLSFEHLPEEFGWRERWRRRLLARRGAARASRVLTDTQAMAEDLESTYRVDPDRIGVVPLAVEESFFKGSAAGPFPEGLSELGLTQPYLLQLGSLLPRRRVDLTLEAFAELAKDEKDLQLVLAGADRLPDRHELSRRIQASGVGDRIKHLSWVPEQLLVPLYAHASATIYVSTYEGYGLPPLESLAAGTPAIVSSRLALDDLWPDYPLRVERTATSLLNGLWRALHEVPDGFVAEARGVVGQLDWHVSARRLVEEILIARGAP